MENLERLLRDLECITIQDIAEIPIDRQHEVVEQIEVLQDQLKSLHKNKASGSKSSSD